MNVLKTMPIAVVLLATTLSSRPGEAAPRWRVALQNAQGSATAAVTRAFDHIEATPKQRAEIRRILAGSATGVLALRTDALRLQDQIAAALLAPEPDDAELDELEKKAIVLIGRSAHLARAGLTDAAAVLSVEQRAELLTLWRRWVRQVAGT